MFLSFSFFLSRIYSTIDDIGFQYITSARFLSLNRLSPRLAALKVVAFALLFALIFYSRVNRKLIKKAVL